MVFDFAARPPEVNSTLIYSGAGAGPMMAAATSFSSLSSELATNAAGYESVISQLTGGGLAGPVVDRNGRRGSAEHRVAETPRRRNCRRPPAKATASAACIRGGVLPARFRRRWCTPNRAQLAALVAHQHPGAEHSGDRGQRGHVRRVLGSRRHRADHVRRQRCNRRAGDPVDRADPEHQPGWLGRASRRGQQCCQQQTRRTPGSTGCSATCRTRPARSPPRRPARRQLPPLGDLYSAVQGLLRGRAR